MKARNFLSGVDQVNLIPNIIDGLMSGEITFAGEDYAQHKGVDTFAYITNWHIIRALSAIPL